MKILGGVFMAVALLVLLVQLWWIALFGINYASPGAAIMATIVTVGTLGLLGAVLIGWEDSHE